MAETSGVDQPAVVASYPHEDRLTVELRHQIGALQLDVAFRLSKPWTILFGPSGSGKTTILRAIAGLVQPSFGRIVSYPREVSTTRSGDVFVDTDAGICVPTRRRGMPLASQSSSLFPHMNVMENLNFGYPYVSGSAEQDHREALRREMPALFHIEDQLEKMPHQLSGGEARRVNLARAVMARNCRVLLLDEPFTGLDAPLRDSLIANVFAWQERYRQPILSVTHDVAEAFQLGAEVIKIDDGKVVEQGPVEVVLAEERKRLLAQLMEPTSQTLDLGYPQDASNEPFLSG